MKTLRPIHDKVLVRLSKRGEERTHGGLVIPGIAKEAPLHGVVVAVGPGRHGEDPPPWSRGDRVVYAKYGGKFVEIEGVEHIVLGAREILGCFAKEGEVVDDDTLSVRMAV